VHEEHLQLNSTPPTGNNFYVLGFIRTFEFAPMKSSQHRRDLEMRLGTFTELVYV